MTQESGVRPIANADVRLRVPALARRLRALAAWLVHERGKAPAQP